MVGLGGLETTDLALIRGFYGAICIVAWVHFAVDFPFAGSDTDFLRIAIEPNP